MEDGMLGRSGRCVAAAKVRGDIIMAWLVGYPREKLAWFPTIDQDKCVKCGMCMNCGKKVFEWTVEGPLVAHPYACQPGCATCMNLCLSEAISFPDVSYIRNLYKREKVWPKVKKQLWQEGRLGTKQD